MAVSDPIRDAFARARSRVALVHFLRRTAAGGELYAVNSSRDPDGAYIVAVVTDQTYVCSCEAAAVGRPACWHRAAVAIRRANDRARAEHLARAAGLIDTPVSTPTPAGPRRLPPREDFAPLPTAVPNVVALAREAERRRRDEAILRPPSTDHAGVELGFKAERGRARG